MNARALATTVTAACIAALLAVACTMTEPQGARDGDNAASGDPSDVIAGKAGDGANPETATGLPCDVDAVLKTRCQTCHASEPKYGASTSLVSWEDLQKPGPGASSGKKVYELVRERIADLSLIHI